MTDVSNPEFHSHVPRFTNDRQIPITTPHTEQGAMSP
jgi:hypothetical protein